VDDSGMAFHLEAGSVMEESPYRIPSLKLGVWLFILSDAVTFGAVLYAYAYLRVGTADWTRPFSASSIVNAIIMTVILLVSSVSVLAGLEAARRQQRSKCTMWLGITVLLGTIFAVLHISEWIRMIHEGWRLFQNPTGGPVTVGMTFFCITGLHLIHIVGGLVALLVVALRYQGGRLQANHVETVGLYWHFVDVVWMFVFPMIYLMNAK
jgi:cytochrome c oxidase subunit 3